jgi:hypothetical protein
LILHAARRQTLLPNTAAKFKRTFDPTGAAPPSRDDKKVLELKRRNSWWGIKRISQVLRRVRFMQASAETVRTRLHETNLMEAGARKKRRNMSRPRFFAGRYACLVAFMDDYSQPLSKQGAGREGAHNAAQADAPAQLQRGAERAGRAGGVDRESEDGGDLPATRDQRCDLQTTRKRWLSAGPMNQPNVQPEPAGCRRSQEMGSSIQPTEPGAPAQTNRPWRAAPRRGLPPETALQGGLGDDKSAGDGNPDAPARGEIQLHRR